MEETVLWLSDILRDQAKRNALFQMRGLRAQSLIDGLNYYVSDPEFRRAAEPWVLKHTVIALRRLCEVSTLYPTCYVLGPIRDISPKGGGGFCDISRGSYGGQLICLKVVRLYQDSNMEQLLKAHAREAILWNQLHHRNIVPFYGIFYLERKERICLVSPWMENGDIVDYLQRVPEAPRKPFIHDIANGLRYLHALNIVHGDLKGRNILIDDCQCACLADFGLSTIITDETLGFAKTTASTFGHTTRWVSPELLEDDARPTRESDVWAFGCVCYEVLTGLTPFAGCSEANVIRKLVMGEVPARLDEMRLDPNELVNKKWARLVGKCWSIDAKQRPGYADILKYLEKDGFARRPWCHQTIPSNRNRLDVKYPGSVANLDLSRELLEELYCGNESSGHLADHSEVYNSPESLAPAQGLLDHNQLLSLRPENYPHPSYAGQEGAPQQQKPELYDTSYPPTIVVPQASHPAIISWPLPTQSLQGLSGPPIKPDEWEEVLMEVSMTQDGAKLQELLVHTEPDLIIPLHKPPLVTQLAIVMLIPWLSQVVNESLPSDDAFKSSLRWLRHAVAAFDPDDEYIREFMPHLIPNAQQVLLVTKQSLQTIPSPATNDIVRDISDIEEALRLKVASIL